MRKPKTEQEIFCDYPECGTAITPGSTRHVIIPVGGLRVEAPTGEKDEGGNPKTQSFEVVSAKLDFHDNCLWKLFKDNLLNSRPKKVTEKAAVES